MEEILLLNKFFFRLSIHALVAKVQPDKVVRCCADGELLATFCVLLDLLYAGRHLSLSVLRKITVDVFYGRPM